MDPIINLILFFCVGIAMLLLSVLAITTRSLLRAAIYLLLVLICTAGLYLFLNFHFLAAVQLSVYAGGVVILFVFAIFLTTNKGEMLLGHSFQRYVYGALAVILGVAVTVFAWMKHRFLYAPGPGLTGDWEINMKVIGQTLLGTGKHQYLLPFEILSVLLLACIIGGILIARKK
ncbi:MAG: NADH-quinone oxidoreductase subunit J [Candidatus Azobacteroides sp.]|nr:NADH-quinone oxidoreductase subunit J [Candidatus Azobacteroides sp.]